ncbi:SulP family inorganic anion transporter [Alkalilacustris brevis]|uniref:SulP family inorganic anion transporter n=1 Tax=Alkalilacustris brevis TaxID=2026338 RepID=UPI000E0CF17A|nr:sulfate permease [Alkalilacustris brevis]
MHRFFPIFDWGRGYDRETFASDLVAAIVVTIMLIPQGMAYAMLAGLPPEAGLYGAMLPLVLYALFGTSRALAVGPVAVVALMTAAAAGDIAQQGTQGYHLAALAIAFLSGALMLGLGLARLGFIANFLSHPVISGFITAAGIIIAGSQIRHLTGIEMGGKTLIALIDSFFRGLGGLHWPTLAISVVVLGFLFWSRKGLAPLLARLGLGQRLAGLLAKGALLAAVAGSTLAVIWLDLEARGVAIVGDIPRGLPQFSMPVADTALLQILLVPAIMIAIVGYVESISIAQTLAAKRRQKIDPDKELVALGMANLGASVTSAMPVTGGLSRSIVNFDAGARTPAAGAMTALAIGVALMFLTPLLYALPNATLAAIIIVAVASLLDFRALPRTWSYSKMDGAAMAATIAVTLLAGVENGLMAGVGLSLALHLYRTSRPHVAIVGQVPGTEHFRNVQRHDVVTAPHVLSIRVDESLYFPNARFLEDTVNDAVAVNPEVTDVVLMFTAVNAVDASALESLEMINARLREAGIRLHLSEVKGPVMDRFGRCHFPDELSGKVFLTQHDAMAALAPEITADTCAAPRLLAPTT